MVSPDATQYVNQTLIDKNPQDIYDNAVAALKMSLVDWKPREGNTEVLLLENLALEVSEAVFSVNRLPNSTIQGVLTLFGINRDYGAQPTTSITFYTATSLGTTIPAGTRCALNLRSGVEPVIFSTDVDLVIPNGSSNGTVTATGDRYTADANGTAVNTVLAIYDSVYFVNNAVIASIVVDGRDPEDDPTYFTRAVERFSRLSDTLVLPRHFEAAALEDLDVERVHAIDNWDGTGATPGTVGGHITLAVYGNNVFLTTTQKTALLNSLTPLALANLTIHIIDPTITSVAVSATVQALVGFDPSQVQADIETMLQGFLNPMTWTWGAKVRVNTLIDKISDVPGVDYVTTLTAPASDVTLTGNAPLVSTGTLSIVVNGA